MTVIKFGDAKLKRDRDESTHAFTVHVMQSPNGRHWGNIEDAPKDLTLDGLGRILRDIAWQADNMGDDPIVAVACIYKSSRISTVVNTDEMETEEQFEWMDERFDEAKEAVRP